MPTDGIGCQLWRFTPESKGKELTGQHLGGAKARPRLIQAVTPLQSLDTALGINHPLFAGVEGVALAAQLHPHGGLGGARMEHVAAGASYHRVIEFRMDVCFHNWIPVNLDLKPEPRHSVLILVWLQ